MAEWMFEWSWCVGIGINKTRWYLAVMHVKCLQLVTQILEAWKHVIGSGVRDLGWKQGYGGLFLSHIATAFPSMLTWESKERFMFYQGISSHGQAISRVTCAVVPPFKIFTKLTVYFEGRDQDIERGICWLEVLPRVVAGRWHALPWDCLNVT